MKWKRSKKAQQEARTKDDGDKRSKSDKDKEVTEGKAESGTTDLTTNVTPGTAARTSGTSDASVDSMQDGNDVMEPRIAGGGGAGSKFLTAIRNSCPKLDSAVSFLNDEMNRHRGQTKLSLDNEALYRPYVV